MKYADYKKAFNEEAERRGIKPDDISAMLNYARPLINQDLRVIFDLRHFSLLVGYDLSFIMSINNSAKTHYQEYQIPKKNGGTRIINEPFPSLKEMQTWILRHILTPASKSHVSAVAKAYMPNVSLKENARFHRGQNKLLTIDLINFFGSIGFHQVYSIFRKLGYSKSVSALMSNLSILKQSLPQGAPTSPMLSNLIFKYYDDKIFLFCTEREIRYTRYADDLAFSGDFNIGELMFFLKKLFKKTRFRINDKKTKVASQGRRQEVTGVVVNKKLQVPSGYRKEIRQCVYFMIKFGVDKHVDNIKWNKSTMQYIYHLLGRVNFVLQINPKDEEAKKYYEYLKDLLN